MEKNDGSMNAFDQVEKRELVSFIVFAYNQEKFIRQAVEGAFSQTYQPLEIILSDDCSTDRTFEIMVEMTASYVGPHVVRTRRNARNLGLAGHINAGVADTNGSIICWAAGDDISLPERTALLAEPMLKDPDVFGTHSKFYFMDVDGIKGQVATKDIFYRPFLLDDIVKHEYRLAAQTHAFRKAVFDFFGPLLNSVTNEGAIMAFREAALGKIIFVDQPTILYRVGSGVSTYSGQDTTRLQHSEPLKVLGWSLSFYEQTLVDLERDDKLSDRYKDHILQKRNYYIALKLINTKRWQLRALAGVLKDNFRDTVAIRAFLRSNTPALFYKILARVRG